MSLLPPAACLGSARRVRLVVAMLLVACETAPVGHVALPIVGGEPATTDQIAGTVAVHSPVGGVCGGVLVRPDLVVTAAHCVALLGEDLTVIRYASPEQITVYAGILAWDDATDRETYSVDRVEAYPDFPGLDLPPPSGLGAHHDIGVLVLSRPVDTASTVDILPAEDVEREVVAGASAVITGYGYVGPDSREEGTLHVASSPIADRSAHELLIGGPGEPDTCSGDSGSPAYLTTAEGTFVIGVVSRSRLDRTRECGDGGLFTLVPAYAMWIDATYGGMPDAGVPPTDDAGRDGPDGGAGPMVAASSTGGCTAAGPARPGWPIAVLLALAVVARRRRGRIPPGRGAADSVV